MKIQKEIDRILNKVANWLIYIIIAVALWLICGKAITGKIMLYEDYYDGKIKIENTK